MNISFVNSSQITVQCILAFSAISCSTCEKTGQFVCEIAARNFVNPWNNLDGCPRILLIVVYILYCFGALLHDKKFSQHFVFFTGKVSLLLRKQLHGTTWCSLCVSSFSVALLGCALLLMLSLKQAGDAQWLVHWLKKKEGKSRSQSFYLKSHNFCLFFLLFCRK